MDKEILNVQEILIKAVESLSKTITNLDEKSNYARTEEEYDTIEANLSYALRVLESVTQLLMAKKDYGQK